MRFRSIVQVATNMKNPEIHLGTPYDYQLYHPYESLHKGPGMKPPPLLIQAGKQPAFLISVKMGTPDNEDLRTIA